jgi:hypothetical protein
MENYLRTLPDGRQIGAITFDSVNGQVEMQIVQSPMIVMKSTPSAADTAWTQAAHAIFTVVGVCKVRIWGVVKTTIVGAGTLGVGVAGATNKLVATVADNTTLISGDIVAGISAASIIPVGTLPEFSVVADIDIDMIIGTTNATAGLIDWYCEYIPCNADSYVVGATWD